ncbi:hypothetical protein [Peterkaempfera griseoplana]|uniref:hypothetical protein n=1 Tax=Peterkaempfera griseoplana TaxID=66896 RepID=UPI0006E24B1A|nr:hypothetical protein [Peterkaempfera griseoplana]
MLVEQARRVHRMPGLSAGEQPGTASATGLGETRLLTLLGESSGGCGVGEMTIVRDGTIVHGSHY